MRFHHILFIFSAPIFGGELAAQTNSVSRQRDAAIVGSRSAPSLQQSASQERAEQLVRSALEADVKGDLDTRDQFLTEAEKLAPQWGPVHWNQGRMLSDGKYQSIAAAITATNQDPRTREFRQLRKRHLGTAEGEEKLARWCARKDLPELANFFYARLLHNPKTSASARKEARRRLGMRVINGRLMTKKQLEQAKLNDRKVAQAFETWGPKLKRWGKSLAKVKSAKADHARNEIRQIDDPAVVPVADAFAARIDGPMAMEFARLLARFPQFEATEALTHYAVLSPSPLARRAAVAELRKRPLHDFVPTLLRALVAPIKSRWSVNVGRDGTIDYRYTLFREGPTGNVQLEAQHKARARAIRHERLISDEENPWRGNGPDPRPIGFRESTDNLAERQRRVARNAKAHALQAAEALHRGNRRISTRNALVFQVLESTTGNRMERSVGKWWDWWQRHNETYKPRPTRYIYRQSRSSYAFDQTTVYARHSCFVAGTQVWTQRGMAPIETIEVGDRVLSQDVNTGELQWKLVTRTTVGGATSDVTTLSAEGEQIKMTLGHVVWVSGKGWRIAKRVAKGDRLHTLNGSAVMDVLGVEPAPRKVYNLVVEGFNTYFIGKQGILVHDITTRRPTLSVLPGLAGTGSRSQ